MIHERLKHIPYMTRGDGSMAVLDVLEEILDEITKLKRRVDALEPSDDRKLIEGVIRAGR